MEPPLRLLFLGPLQNVHRGACEMPCPADGSQDALWAELRARFPGLGSQSVRLARHDEFLAPGDSLRPGDEIALIPPVSGG